MHYTKLTLGLFALAVRADLQLEAEDVPPQCSNICRPIVDLGNSCDVNDDYVPDDQTEDLLELQCVCTNDSFDVGSVAALCASCMDQNIQDRDDLDDINEIVSRCGFSTTSYAASASTEAQGVTVSAARPTASDQLTTTISTGVGRAAGGLQASRTAASSVTSTVTNSDGSTSTITSAATVGAAASTTNTPNAAPAVGPVGGSFGAVGAGAAGFFMLGAFLL